MKKSSFWNHFVLLAGIILAMALSGCSNPFLQLGSQSISQASQGIAGVVAIPPDIEDIEVPGGEDPVLPPPLTAKVKFYLPALDSIYFTTPLFTHRPSCLGKKT